MSSAAPMALRRSIAGELSACVALFGLTVRQHTHGRRVIVLALLYALPCALAVLLRVIPHPAPADELEFALVFNLLPHALAPFTALLYAAGVIQDEVEEQTLTYLLMRSVPRWALYVTKLAATLCVTVVLVALATLALYAAIYWDSPDFVAILSGRALRTVAVMAVAQVAYCALFGLLGLLTRRSLIAGIGFIVVVEGILANIEFVLRQFTVAFYFRTLDLRSVGLPEDIREKLAQREWSMDLELIPTAGEAVRTLVVFGVMVTALTAVWFARREFHVKTPESS